MYSAATSIKPKKNQHGVFVFNRFALRHQSLIQGYIDRFKPESCEYNFANLYTWQHACHMSWTIYDGRFLIYDGLSNAVFMPLGDDMYPEELVVLSLHLQKAGIRPDIELASEQYLKKYPAIEMYFQAQDVRDASEYIYDVNSLCELKGSRLQKKKNLISQFVRQYPDYKVTRLTGNDFTKVLIFAADLLGRKKNVPKELDREFDAIRQSLEHFESLGLEGLRIEVKGQMTAFSIFSRLSSSTYDIQFEKADPVFKGSAQMINYQTALYLKEKCQYLNREQDLGIKGLRQAKLSYEPVTLITPCTLKFAPVG